MTKPPSNKDIAFVRHAEDKRTNIPSAEFEPVLNDQERNPLRVAYQRRNRDLDPQLVWRGKDAQDWSDLIVQAPPLYIQEWVHPKVLIDDLLRSGPAQTTQLDLFADFNGLPAEADKTDFYQHEQNWSNRMILGDSLQVMASLAEREALRGKVQCIYLDPPYGIKFNSNFQWSTTSRDVKDGNAAHITREPEQVKAFRDTWRDGIHSYLTYLRDRLTVARDLLTDSGSIFVQIGDENVHRVRALMDEVFGEENFVSEIVFTKTRSLVSSDFVTTICDYILWFAKNKEAAKGKMNKVLIPRVDNSLASHYQDEEGELISKIEYAREGTKNHNYRPLMSDNLIRPANPLVSQFWQGRKVEGKFRTSSTGIVRALKANRILFTKSGVRYKFFLDDFAASPLNHLWSDVIGAQDLTYVVQTNTKVIERCILMSTDPGDLVLDPTCGSGTTAYVAEQWGRRWITIDTSRVALALARARIMGARYPFYLLADSREGQIKEATVTRTAPSSQPVRGNIRQGFVYERVPHITLKSIANNTEIDVLWDKWQAVLEPLRAALNNAIGNGSGQDSQDLQDVTITNEQQNARIPNPANPVNPVKKECGQDLQDLQDVTTTNEQQNARIPNPANPVNPVKKECGQDSQDLQDLSEAPKTNPVNPVNPVKKFLEEWEIPRTANDAWTDEAKHLHAQWWQARISRQQAIDASIAAKAEYEYLYDKPYEDKKKVRVAGPFTVESLSPHRVLGVDENDELIDTLAESKAGYSEKQTFAQIMLEQLRIAGVQQANKQDKITFTTLTAWPGYYICAEGRYQSEQGGQDLQDSQDVTNGQQKERVPNPANPVNPVQKEHRQDSQDSQDVTNGQQNNNPVNPVNPVNSINPAQKQQRAAIFIGPEFGTVQRSDLVAAAKEASEAAFDLLIACAFSYEGRATDFSKLGRLPVLKARMNADLHMAEDLKNTGKGNLFVIFGEPDISILSANNGMVQVRINGVDVFHPNTGEVRSDNADGIACWFIDSDYNEESFFVRQAYFLGANDPYSALKTTLKAEINEAAWATLNSDTSRPFAKPQSGRIAVKVINHLGDEVMKVFKVS